MSNGPRDLRPHLADDTRSRGSSAESARPGLMTTEFRLTIRDSVAGSGR